MQQNFVDAADRFKSLDDIWYFGGQDEHRQVAVLEHHPETRDELELRIGWFPLVCLKTNSQPFKGCESSVCV